MVPPILQSRNSLLREITKLHTKIKDLTERFNLLANWITIQYEIKDLPDDVVKAMRQCSEAVKKLEEPVLGVVGNEGNTEIVTTTKSCSRPAIEDYKCRICNKKLKNITVLKAHEREHLPPEVLVPINRRKGDKRIFKKRRHAYRCLTCEVIITDRRKYLAHVTKHRKDSKQKAIADDNGSNGSVGKFEQTDQLEHQYENGPFVKLFDINSLSQRTVIALKREHGISNLNSIIESLSAEFCSNDIKRPIEESVVGYEEELPYLLPFDDGDNCDPLADISPTFRDVPLQENSEEEIHKPTGPFKKISSESKDVSVDYVKEEINGDEDIFKIETTGEEELGDHNVAYKDNFLVLENSDENLENLSNENVRKNRRKSHHSVLNEHYDSSEKMRDKSSEISSAKLVASSHKGNNAKEDNEEVICEICNKRLKNINVYKRHKIEHLAPEVLLPLRGDGTDRSDCVRQRHKYRCLICDMVMTDKRKYISHVNSHDANSATSKRREISKLKRKSEKDDDEYNCDLCDAKYQYKSGLKKHKEETHLPPEVILPYYSKLGYANPLQNRRRYRCTLCEIILTDKRKYIHHVNGHKKGATDVVSDNAGPWNCKLCTKLFQTRSGFIRHQAAHENENALETDTLKGKRVHGNNFPCNLCGKSFRSNTAWEGHMNKHTGDRPYLCSVCGKGFIRKAYMLTHELTHSEKRSFKCDYCEKTFKVKQAKYFHERRHTGSHIVICNLCGFSFRGEHNLRRHIQGVHENIRSHQCHLCDKKFKERAVLKYHLKTHDNPNSRQRSINRHVDPLKAAAKRKRIANPNVIPIISSPIAIVATTTTSDPDSSQTPT